MAAAGKQPTPHPSLPSPPGKAPTEARIDYMTDNPPFSQGQPLAPQAPPPPPSAPGKAPSIPPPPSAPGMAPTIEATVAHANNPPLR